jgi:ABC-type Fe3+ transport system substrate-binding protein
MLAAACAATGLEPRLELFGSGSLFQRLQARRAQPHADVVLWFGPYAAQSAAAAGFLQGHQPASLPEQAARHPGWLWSAVEFSPFRVVGNPDVTHLSELATVPRLALADPERAETGLALVLAMLDRARQADGNPEAAWTWWTERTRGMRLVDDDAAALALAQAGRASHAITLSEQGEPLTGLAPLPHAIALAAGAPNADAGRRLIDWLTAPSAPTSAGRLSAWHAASDGLHALLEVAPRLDVEWATQQYTPSRRRWAQSGFGPALEPA